MSTPAELAARIRAENPTFTINENAQHITVSPEEFPEWYEELIAERVLWATEAEAQAVLDAAEATRREKAKAAYTRLKAGTATNAQVQEVVAWLLRQEIRELAP
jgi:hypothetical protein